MKKKEDVFFVCFRDLDPEQEREKKHKRKLLRRFSEQQRLLTGG